MFNTITTQTNSLCNLCESYFPTNEAEGIQVFFPDRGKLRSRKVVTRSRARKTGKIPSWKMGRMLQWESKNERLVFRILDGDATVTALFEQPLTVCYEDEGVLMNTFQTY